MVYLACGEEILRRIGKLDSFRDPSLDILKIMSETKDEQISRLTKEVDTLKLAAAKVIYPGFPKGCYTVDEHAGAKNDLADLINPFAREELAKYRATVEAENE